MKHLNTFNESLRDKMVAKSDEEIKNNINTVLNKIDNELDAWGVSLLILPLIGGDFEKLYNYIKEHISLDEMKYTVNRILEINQISDDKINNIESVDGLYDYLFDAFKGEYYGESDILEEIMQNINIVTMRNISKIIINDVLNNI